MSVPTVGHFMTPQPHTIGAKLPLRKALEAMRSYSIRHLPVQEAGDLVGVITDRDIKLAASFGDPDGLTVEDVMTPDPYSVTAQAGLDAVAAEMAKNKYGCAIVVSDGGKVEGIFTDVDALLALARLIQAKS